MRRMETALRFLSVLLLDGLCEGPRNGSHRLPWASKLFGMLLIQFGTIKP